MALMPSMAPVVAKAQQDPHCMKEGRKASRRTQQKRKVGHGQKYPSKKIEIITMQGVVHFNIGENEVPHTMGASDWNQGQAACASCWCFSTFSTTMGHLTAPRGRDAGVVIITTSSGYDTQQIAVQHRNAMEYTPSHPLGLLS
jgi:hypothetical protein